jgi:hypothetical protein
MASGMSTPPGRGGMFFEKMQPIWYPPVSVPWIISFLLVLGAANAEALPPRVHAILTHPAGFFITFLVALAAYDAGFAPATFAILFFLLMVWATQRRREGFQLSNTVDWVTNHKRWFAEVVLKEKPMGIREKDVSTYPVQGDTPSN